MKSCPPNLSSAQSGRILGLVLLGLLTLGIGGTVVLQLEKQPEHSPVSRGARLADEAGCFACHGRGEEEPRFNLRQAAPGKWRSKSNPSLGAGEITKVSVLVDWITHGVPADEADKHRQLFIRMPAYQDRLSPGEIEDIAAWILAEGLKVQVDLAAKPPAPPVGAALSPDQLLIAGDRLARQTGCYQCHGELGQGGGSNPDSFKGYIPGFQGRDFLKLTADGDRAEILHWIDHGRGRAIEAGPLGRLAKKYFGQQAISMPGYRDQLTATEKELLADYLLLINKAGPLSAQEIERIVQLHDPSSS
jgi:mono/diheme cytochrome c family protein